MANRYQLPIRVYEQPVRSPKTLEDADRNRKLVQLKIDHVIKGRNVDDVRAKARVFLEKDLGRTVRSLSVGVDEISAVVYGESVKKDPRTIKASRLNRGR